MLYMDEIGIPLLLYCNGKKVAMIWNDKMSNLLCEQRSAITPKAFVLHFQSKDITRYEIYKSLPTILKWCESFCK